MPTYDYECTRCERRFEEFQSITAKPFKNIKTDCAECGNKAPVRRLIGTGAAVLFKGSGFYETDYRSDSYKKDAKADKKPDKKADTKTETKSTDAAAKATDTEKTEKKTTGDSSKPKSD